MGTKILTKQQAKHLLEVYRTEGRAAAEAIAPNYGVKPSYVRCLAFKHGVRAKTISGPRWRPSHKRDDDPRWAWAVERGQV